MSKTTVQRLKGFNDFFAEDMKLRKFVINIFETTFEKYGYEPLETPALELTELMLGQSGSEAEKMFYRFNDPGNRDVMLKYEVMTSMCRAVAQNINNIKLPYKRYQIQRVWRAENTQGGRYREFTQCDADTIGSSSMLADGEFIAMGIEITGKLGFKDYVARISNRKFLQGIAEVLGINDDKFYGFAMSLDKLLKIGKEAVIEEMVSVRGIDKDKAEKALSILDTAQYENSNFATVIEKFRPILKDSNVGTESLNELSEILAYLQNAGVKAESYIFDTSLARGLASYTGPVWEFEIKDGGVGSIAGCGRYDNVIGKYLGYPVPATGGSFGIERICDILKARKMTNLGSTTTDIMVALFDTSLIAQTQKLAQKLRDEGNKVMLYPDADKLGKQFKYADEKGIGKVAILGQDELDRGVYKIKELSTRTETEFPL